MTLGELYRTVTGLHADELEHWIGNAWVRPQGQPGAYVFAEIDVARVRLIFTLRHELEVEEPTLPIVLSLLDQLHDTRRHMGLLRDALREALPEDSRAAVHAALRRRLNED